MFPLQKLKRYTLKNMSNKITKDILFSELMEKFPEAIEILFEHGMHCIGCTMSSYETLEQGALVHGLDPDKLVKEINKLLASKNKGKK